MSEKLTNFGKIGDIHLKMNIPASEECYAGFNPVEYNVVIAPAVLNKTVGKLGLIHMAESSKDLLDMAVQVGRIVEISPLAFNYANWGESHSPQLGQLVWFAKFAGGIFEGVDGKEYRIVKDKDIGGVLPEIDQDRLTQVKALTKAKAANNEAKVA